MSPSRPSSPNLVRGAALRPAFYAGLAAAVVSISAAVAIRVSPSLETPIAGVHLLLTCTLYALGGALAARLGASGWRAGLYAGLIDAVLGHTVSYLIAAPLEASRAALSGGAASMPQGLANMQLWGAVAGAVMAIAIAMGCGAAGGWYARRRRG